jgi:enoyl-CoA hydratase
VNAEPVRVQRRGPATVVTIDRPERRNAIDGPTASALVAALDAFEADADARVMVLTGAQGSFCAGADLTALETLEPRLHGDDGPLGFTRRVPEKPTIAAIEGWAVAGGLELALWCDLRIAAPTAKFGCLERRFGVPLVDGGTWRLPRVVGFGRALDLLLTGRVVDADEAYRIGLVTELADQPLARAVALAEQLASYPQDAMLSDRASMYGGYGLSRADALALEARNGTAVLAAARGGVERFLAGEGRGADGA